MESKRGQAGHTELVKSFPPTQVCSRQCWACTPCFCSGAWPLPAWACLRQSAHLLESTKMNWAKVSQGQVGRLGGTPLQLSEADIRAEALSAQLAHSTIFCGGPGRSQQHTLWLGLALLLLQWPLSPFSLSRELNCVELPGPGDKHGVGPDWVISPPHVFGGDYLRDNAGLPTLGLFHPAFP